MISGGNRNPANAERDASGVARQRRRIIPPPSPPTDTRRQCNSATTAGLKACLRPMRSLKRDRTASVLLCGHALVQNIRRGHYELGTDAREHHRLRDAFAELAT